jgi:hypothetical protein
LGILGDALAIAVGDAEQGAAIRIAADTGLVIKRRGAGGILGDIIAFGKVFRQPSAIGKVILAAALLQLCDQSGVFRHVRRRVFRRNCGGFGRADGIGRMLVRLGYCGHDGRLRDARQRIMHRARILRLVAARDQRLGKGDFVDTDGKQIVGDAMALVTAGKAQLGIAERIGRHRLHRFAMRARRHDRLSLRIVAEHLEQAELPLAAIGAHARFGHRIRIGRADDVHRPVGDDVLAPFDRLGIDQQHAAIAAVHIPPFGRERRNGREYQRQSGPEPRAPPMRHQPSLVALRPPDGLAGEGPR